MKQSWCWHCIKEQTNSGFRVSYLVTWRLPTQNVIPPRFEASVHDGDSVEEGSVCLWHVKFWVCDSLFSVSVNCQIWFCDSLFSMSMICQIWVCDSMFSVKIVACFNEEPARKNNVRLWGRQFKKNSSLLPKQHSGSPT